MTDTVRLGLFLIGSVAFTLGVGLFVVFVGHSTDRRGVLGFRRLFLAAYAILGVGIFAVTIQLYAYFGLPASTWPKRVLQGISGAGTLLAAIQPTVIRPCFHSRGRLTWMGRWASKTFRFSEDQLHRAISVPWRLSLGLGLAATAINAILGATR